MFSIILAAGKGTRMGPIDLPKVCLDLYGKPVIVRAMNRYARCGVEHHIVVVGDRAQEVMAAIAGPFPKTIFAYQPEQKGTGHATRCGANVLQTFGYEGSVMVVAGDKILAETAILEMIEVFRSAKADLCLLVGAREDYPSSGRIVEESPGRVVGIVEVSDIARARLIARWFEATEADRSMPAESVRAQMLEAFATERKAQRAFPKLWPLLDREPALTRELLEPCATLDDAYFTFGTSAGEPLRLTGEEIEQQAEYANLSVYLFRMAALRHALGRLAAANAQGEEYLTDAIHILANARTLEGHPRFRLIACPITRRTDALAFNSMEELEEIREVYGELTST